MKKLYMAVTGDELELPIMVEESAKAIADKFGKSKNTVYSEISHGCNGKYSGVKFVKVEIEDEQDND